MAVRLIIYISYFALLVFGGAGKHVIRVGPVTDPSLSIRFGPESMQYDCELETEQPDLRKLAMRSRWALLTRHCKFISMDGWDYHLCFGGSFTRSRHIDNYSEWMGFYNDTMDTYTDDYFIQHYTNGTKLGPDSEQERHTAEVRCSCGKGEPKIKSVVYNDHSIILVEMPSCCPKVEVSDILALMPAPWAVIASGDDWRFPLSTIRSLHIDFSEMTLALDKKYTSRKIFSLGKSRFLSHIPDIALGTMAPRKILRAEARPTLFIPVTEIEIDPQIEELETANGRPDPSLWLDSDDEVMFQREQRQQRFINRQKAASIEADNSSSSNGKPKKLLLGGIFCRCDANWNRTVSDELVKLIQARYIPGAVTTEVYIIIESLAFCGLHQLLIRPDMENYIQCHSTDKDTKNTNTPPHPNTHQKKEVIITQ